jgi:hypothetical protein
MMFLILSVKHASRLELHFPSGCLYLVVVVAVVKVVVVAGTVFVGVGVVVVGKTHTL